MEICCGLKLQFSCQVVYNPNPNQFFHVFVQEKSITILESDHQEAKKEIISLKEQLASISEVSADLDNFLLKHDLNKGPL